MNTSFHVGDNPLHVTENRRLLLSEFGIAEENLAIPVQVHGNTVRVVDAPGRYDSCDALVTSRKGLFLTVSVADCLPVVIVDPVLHVVAIAHAGWRGTASGIAERAVGAMTQVFDSKPADVVAFVGPGAGVCCYEIGENVWSQFEKRFLRHVDGRTHLDLKEACVAQLVGQGVPRSRIKVSSHCTVCEDALLHSFRRDKKDSGRMMAIVGLVA